MRKFISATVSAALCLMSAAPAMAQEYRFAGFDPPRGATATLNLRVPIGGEHVERPTYGLTVGYGYAMGGPNLNGRTVSRSVNFADFRFSGDEMRNARIASFDLANLDQDRRLNLTGSGKKTWLLLGAIVVAGVVICIAAECFDGDDDEDEGTSTPGT